MKNITIKLIKFCWEINSNKYYILLGLIKFVKNIAYGIGGGVGFKLSTIILKDNQIKNFLYDIDTVRKIIENDIAFTTIKKIDKLDEDYTNNDIIIKSLGIIFISSYAYILSKQRLF